MKHIAPDELYCNLSAFLKSKGIAFKEGSYTSRIRRGCRLLTDAINVTQAGLQRAKTEVDQKLEQMRDVIKGKSQAASAAGSSPRTPRKQSASRRTAKPAPAAKKRSVKGRPKKP